MCNPVMGLGYGEGFYALLDAGELLQSADDGASWTLVARPDEKYMMGYRMMFVDPMGRFVIVVGDEGVYRWARP